MPAIIGALVAALIGALRAYLPGLIGRLLLTIGIGFAVHQLAMPALLGLIQAKVSGLPSLLVQYYGALGLDVCTTMFLSAYAAKATQKVLLTKLSSSP